MTPVLNGWVLGAYTAMLGRLSAATAALEATEVPNIPSDSDSESEHSSYTEKYVEFSTSSHNYNTLPFLKTVFFKKDNLKFIKFTIDIKITTLITFTRLL